MSLWLRPAGPADEKFLYELTYQTMFEQLYAWAWAPELRHGLLDMQIRAQSSAYASMYPHAEYGVIIFNDQPVGRLIIDRTGEFYHLIDISIVPKHRGAGMGTRLILAICTEAEMMRKNVRLHVNTVNQRAADLYRRLGFQVIQDLQVQLVMERQVGARSQVIAAP